MPNYTNFKGSDPISSHIEFNIRTIHGGQKNPEIKMTESRERKDGEKQYQCVNSKLFPNH